MALIVENGTGLPNADSYVSLAGFLAHCDAFGYDYAGIGNTVLETRIREATVFIDTFARYKGQRLQASQMLEFPRAGLSDWSGLIVEGVPARVVKACCELAWKAGQGALLEDLDRGGQIKSESVGPLSVTYADGAPTGKSFTVAERLLQQYIRTTGDTMRGPAWQPPAPGNLFGIGMHDAIGDNAGDD